MIKTIKRVNRPVTRVASSADLDRWNSVDKGIPNSQRINHQPSCVSRSVTREAARVANPDDLKLCNSMDQSTPNSQQINHQPSIQETTIYISQSNTYKQYDTGTFQAVTHIHIKKNDHQ